jgi:hypothetical protein
MAAHMRTQIRNAVASLLAGLSTTGSNVFKSRVQQYADNKLPALNIVTNNEDVTTLTVGERTYEKNLTVAIFIKCKATDDVDEEIDQIMLEVEQAIAANPTLGGLVTDMTLTAADAETRLEVEKETGQGVMAYIANYYVEAANPDVSL